MHNMEAINPIVKRAINRFLLLAAISVLWSCSSPSVYSELHALPESGWKAEEPVHFEVPVSDTATIHNVFIHVRHSGAYDYRNLFLFITTHAPSGAHVVDTLDVQLGSPAGVWYGSGWGDLYDNKIPFKYQVRFPVTGTYSFSLVQGMRQEPLLHVTDVGLSVEKVEL